MTDGNRVSSWTQGSGAQHSRQSTLNTFGHSRPPVLWMVNMGKPGTHERHPTAPCQQTKSISSKTSLTGKCLSSPRSQQKVPFNSAARSPSASLPSEGDTAALSSHTERNFLLLAMFVLLTPPASILRGIVKDDESNISRQAQFGGRPLVGQSLGFSEWFGLVLDPSCGYLNLNLSLNDLSGCPEL